MFDKWTLPKAICINGNSYEIYTDYRDILNIFKIMTSTEDETEAIYISLALFYKGFIKMSSEDKPKAWECLNSFIAGGEEIKQETKQPMFDWEQDYSFIVSDINKLAGEEIREKPYMHWFTFLSLFMGIGEGRLSTIVGIREKLKKGEKLDSAEKEFYKDNKEAVKLKQKATAEEQEYIVQLNKKFGR